MLRRIHHIAVICSDYQRSRRFYTETLGLRHLAFAVDDVRVDEYTGRRLVFFADPDGLPLELYQD